jgi:PAS domain S-box-containing protein
MGGMVSASDTDGEASKNKTLKAAAPKKGKLEIDALIMTPQEKQKVNRDRNREHARNTRLRKKAYLEKLKTTVDELCRERDTLVSERAGAANLLVEIHNTRTEVLMSFFALRTSNEKRRKLWESILDESSFTCVMPVTPYRSFPSSEVQVSRCQRTVEGIDGMMADTASLHVLLDSLVDRSKFPYGKIECRYTLVTEEAVVAGNQIMARWVMTTTNAIQYGARMEVAKQGMLCCKFNSAHKITGLELMFDVMAFMLQLKQAAGSEGFSVIPNTVQTCQKTFDKPMVITLADPPYTIIQVNKLWEDMTGFKAEEVVGKTSCAILQGQKKDKKTLGDMMNEVRYKRPASAMLVNTKKTGETFSNFLLIFPLSTDSRICYCLGLTMYTAPGEPPIPAAVPKQAAAAEVIQPSSTTIPAAGEFHFSGTQVTGLPQARPLVPPAILFAGMSSIPAVPGGMPGSMGLTPRLPLPMTARLGQLQPPTSTSSMNLNNVVSTASLKRPRKNDSS